MATSTSENQGFAPPGKHSHLSCGGRRCAQCEKCRDWYYTGNLKDWKWIQDYSNGKDDDWERFYNGGLAKCFKRRDDATCHCRSYYDHDTDYSYSCHFRFNNCFCADNVDEKMVKGRRKKVDKVKCQQLNT